ncbi:MAG: hypothetical protein PHG20_10520 [Geobacteraceae bacterium]|nr:hypothetical protein [Geobacteraceae bacterium]
MDYKGYRHISRALFDAITFLAGALPKRSVSTFLELLFGAMLTQTGKNWGHSPVFAGFP